MGTVGLNDDQKRGGALNLVAFWDTDGPSKFYWIISILIALAL